MGMAAGTGGTVAWDAGEGCAGVAGSIFGCSAATDAVTGAAAGSLATAGFACGAGKDCPDGAGVFGSSASANGTIRNA